MRILLVEDENTLSKYISKGLSLAGYAVDCAYDGEHALYEYQVNEYDLIVLDLNLPIVDGLDVLKQIRKKDSAIKIIILSARTKINDRVLGLDLGANDYLTKPFDFMELEARIRNLLRRQFHQEKQILTNELLCLDTSSKQVTYNNQPINLTRKEYGILEYLMMHPDVVVSAETLTEHVWNNDYSPFSNTFRYHIHSLKKKLQTVSNKEFITTVHGQGYRMEKQQ